MTNSESNPEHKTHSKRSSYNDISSQGLINHLKDHQKQLEDQLEEVQNRPGGFKLDAVGILKKHREELRAKDQLAEFNEDWNKNGGDAIDKAQEAVDSLNFRSNATDHVYAKAALRDAKDAFYKNVVDVEDEAETTDVEVETDTKEELDTTHSDSETQHEEDIPEKTKTATASSDHRSYGERFVEGKDPETYVSPEMVKEALKKYHAERKLQRAAIEASLDDLEKAVSETPEHDDIESEIDELEVAVNDTEKTDTSPIPSPETQRGWFKRNKEHVRKLATQSRERTTQRMSFKKSLRNVKEKMVNVRLKSINRFGNIISNFNRNRQKETFMHQQIEQYSDGQMNLVFSDKGDRVPIGPSSAQKYGRYFDLDDMAIITTESGKQYGLVKGYLIDKLSGEAHALPPQSIDLTIGKKAKLPIIGKIGAITSLQLRYKVDQPGSSLANIHSTDPNPFTKFEDIANQQETANV